MNMNKEDLTEREKKVILFMQKSQEHIDKLLELQIECPEDFYHVVLHQLGYYHQQEMKNKH